MPACGHGAVRHWRRALPGCREPGSLQRSLSAHATLSANPSPQKEKESSGIPDVPGGGSKLLEVSFASIEDRKLRGSLRDASYIEAQITALQVLGARPADACLALDWVTHTWRSTG